MSRQTKIIGTFSFLIVLTLLILFVATHNLSILNPEPTFVCNLANNCEYYLTIPAGSSLKDMTINMSFLPSKTNQKIVVNNILPTAADDTSSKDVYDGDDTYYKHSTRLFTLDNTQTYDDVDVSFVYDYTCIDSSSSSSFYPVRFVSISFSDVNRTLYGLSTILKQSIDWDSSAEDRACRRDSLICMDRGNDYHMIYSNLNLHFIQPNLDYPLPLCRNDGGITRHQVGTGTTTLNMKHFKANNMGNNVIVSSFMVMGESSRTQASTLLIPYINVSYNLYDYADTVTLSVGDKAITTISGKITDNILTADLAQYINNYCGCHKSSDGSCSVKISLVSANKLGYVEGVQKVTSQYGDFPTCPVVCDKNKWLPSLEEVCTTKNVTQTNECGDIKVVSGTKVCETSIYDKIKLFFENIYNIIVKQIQRVYTWAMTLMTQ